MDMLVGQIIQDLLTFYILVVTCDVSPTVILSSSVFSHTRFFQQA